MWDYWVCENCSRKAFCHGSRQDVSDQENDLYYEIKKNTCYCGRNYCRTCFSFSEDLCCCNNYYSDSNDDDRLCWQVCLADENTSKKVKENIKPKYLSAEISAVDSFNSSDKTNSNQKRDTENHTN
jgi:hypothetical protein